MLQKKRAFDSNENKKIIKFNKILKYLFDDQLLQLQKYSFSWDFGSRVAIKDL